MKFLIRTGALALGLAMTLSFGGCNLVKVDEEKDMEQIVAKVKDRDITKEELTNAVEQRIRQLEQYGQTASTEEVSSEVLENLISSEVMIQKAEELGKYEATEERAKELEDYYNEMIDYYLQAGGYLETATGELGAEAAEDAVKTKALELFTTDITAEGGSMEEMRKSVEDYKATVWLQEDFFDTIEASDEDVKSWYDTQVEEQKAAIEADPAAVNNYQTHAYMPEGYKYVRHILLKFDEEKTAKLAELITKQEEIAAKMSKLIVEDEKANNAEISELRNDNNDVKIEIDALKAELYTKAEEVLQKAQAGSDFEVLIKEYGEDEGMKDETLKGYLVGKENSGYVESFFEAAKDLKEGEISGIVEGYAPDSYHGYHIIKNIEDIKVGSVALEEIPNAKEEALEEKKQAEWIKQVDTWVEEAKVERIDSALEDNTANYDVAE